jgi:hypothetical protein
MMAPKVICPDCEATGLDLRTRPWPEHRRLGCKPTRRTEWPRLHQHSCTYRALSDLAALGQPTSKGTPETPGMRQDLIHRIDDFYEGRKEAGKT